MSVNIARVNLQLGAERLNELPQHAHLRGRRAAGLKVAAQADADPVLVEVSSLTVDAEVASRPARTVRPLNLPPPARPHVNLPIRIVHAVANHEVVAQPVLPLSHPQVIIVHALRRRDGTVGVMHDDALPVASSQMARKQLVARKAQRPLLTRRRGRRGLRRDGCHGNRRPGHQKRFRRRARGDALVGRRAAGDPPQQKQDRQRACNPLHL